MRHCTSDSWPKFESLEQRLLLSVDLPGMQLVDPTVDRFDGQVVVLDFDGAEDVDYHGPVAVNGIDVPAFRAPDELAGQEQEIIGQTLGLVQSSFAGSGVLFTLDRPSEGAFSTVYIGGDGADFSDFGEFPGLAEQVDAGNTSPSDIAFVFSDGFIESDASALAQRLATNISHETGHLLGYAHDSASENADTMLPLAAYSGRIVSALPSTFVGGKATTVTVRVQNTGDSSDMIIEWDSAPAGWSVSPKNTNPTIPYNGYHNATFTVTPPVPGGSGTIVWKFYDDGWGVHPSGSTLLDTENQAVSATASRPDLIAYSVSVTDTTVDPGQSVTVNWTAKNQGQAGAGATRQGVMWSTDSTITRGDTLLEKEYLGSMGVNVTSPEAHTITIPANATPGATYYIGVYADYDLAETESNESNNGSGAVAVTINGPDLIAYNVSVDDTTPIPGQSVTVTWTAKNQGTRSAGSTEQGVMWSADSTITRGDTLLDREYLGSMGVNATSPESRRITIPSGATIGQKYYIGVYADYDLDVTELNENNNGSSGVPVTVVAPPKPDLIAYGVSVSDTTVNPGQSVTVNWTAKNQGQAGAGATQQGVMWSTDGTILRSDTLLEKEYLGSMGVNVTSPEAHTITIPANATPGATYYIGVYADYDLAETESSESNNGSSGVAVTINQADLIVTDILMNGQTTLPSVKSGDSVSLDFDVLNQGTATTIPAVHLKWWWGTSEYAMTNEIATGDLGSINGLAPNETERETDASWTIPELSADTYWLTAKIDWDGRVDESNEGNNVRSESFTVVLPDLIVSAVTGPGAAYDVGQTINATATIKNVDLGTAPGSNLYYYLGTADGSDKTYRPIEQGSVGSLAYNATANDQINFGWTIPADVAEGIYRIWVLADSSGTVAESNEGNNWGSSGSFSVAPQFAPFFDDVRIANRVDQDGDGYMRQFDIEFDVDSNIAGIYYVEVWEDDPSIGGWGDDYIGTSPILVSAGSDDTYVPYTVVTEAHGLALGEAEFVLKLYDATTDDLIQTWHKGDDSDLGGVLVEYEYQDADRATAIDYLAQALRNVLDVGPGGDHPLFNLGVSFEIGDLVKVLSGAAAPAPPVAAAIYGIGTVLDFLNTNVHFGLTVDLADLLFDTNLDPWTQDGVDGYVTCFLTGGATLVDLSTGANLPVNMSLSTAPAENALASYYGEPNVGGGTILELTGSYGTFSASMSVDTEGVSSGVEYDLMPTSWDFGGGLKALTFDYPFLAFDLHVSVFRAITLGTAFSPFFAALVDIIDTVGDGIRVLPDDPAQFSLADILIARWTGEDAPDLVRPAWPDTQGELRDFSGGIDANDDGFGDGYYPAIPVGEVPVAAYPYLTGLDVANTGFQEDDFFVEVKDVPPDWFVEADDGWPSDTKYDVTDVPAGGQAMTRWVIAPYEGAQAEEVEFHLYHDRFGFWANEYLTTLVVPVHVGDPQGPEIGGLSDSPDPVTRGMDLTLTAHNVTDPDSVGDGIARVEFYRDSNHNDTLDGGDQFLGTGTNWGASLDWEWSGSTAGFDLGTNRYFARAQDDGGTWGNTATTTGMVSNAPPIAVIDQINPNPAQPPSQDVHFYGTGQDTDGGIVAREWRSDLDGLLSTSEDWSTSSNNLTVGQHQISFRVRDNDDEWSDWVYSSLTVNNAQPTAEISGIPDLWVLGGSTVQLILGGHDNDENGQSIVAGELTLDGNVIANPPPGVYSLVAPTETGPHTVQYRVQDDEGTWSPATPAYEFQVHGEALAWAPVAHDHWEDGANWTGGMAPGETHTAVLHEFAAYQPTLYQDEGVRGVDLQTPGWTIGGSGQTLTVGFGGIDSSGSGTNRADPNVALGADSTWTVGDGNTLVLNGVLGGGDNTLTKGGEGTLVLNGGQNYGTGLSLAVNGGTVRLGGAAEVLVTAELTVDPADSFLDIAASNLVIDYAPAGEGPLTQITGWLQSGQNLEGGGYWDGPSICSSAAAGDPTGLTTLGVLDNAEFGRTDLEGTPVDESSVLVKYTYYGDADLDGNPTGDDYFLWLAGFDEARRALAAGEEPALGGWLYGDFDYSGDITGDDYFLWLVAFDAARGGALPLAADNPAPLGQAMPRAGLSAEEDLLALAVASGTVVGPLGAGEEHGAATALPIAAAAVAVPETGTSTLNCIEPGVDTVRQPDVDLFVRHEGTSPDRSGALSHALDDDLVDVLELVALEVALGV